MYKKNYLRRRKGMPGVPAYLGRKSYGIMNTLTRDMGIITESHDHIRHGLHYHGMHRFR